ncbi:hypothetical protein [Lapillicoccus jejuensis]|uniref:Uncharacterized protein n=1 Tax=Lapillicoccus jejuensis TaxID=402171 RepID=A0A542DWH2_9MICO|nr:hypothetical protein [Lapillicoccus jejuensis]TQJ07443.1 hypothetical protein FB458_0505 [Lapillicoccus jejuensis]
MLRRTTLLVGTLAGASAVVLSAGPALAATTYTVKAGTTTSGSTAYSAATTGAGQQIKFTTSKGLNLGCDSGTASGSVKLGSKLSGTGLGTISGSTWTNCIGPAGLKLAVTQVGTWSINAKGTTTATGVTAGTIGNIVANVGDAAGACKFTVSGTVKAAVTATATKQLLKVKPTTGALTISNVAGCFGAVANGDTASFAATYKITAAAGKLSISNP